MNVTEDHIKGVRFTFFNDQYEHGGWEKLWGGNDNNACEILYLDRSQTNLPFNLLKPTGYVMHHQFNIQQQYTLPTLYLCVLYLSENKQRFVPLFYNRAEKCFLRGTNWVFK